MTVAAILELVVSLVRFAMLVVGEIFEQKKAARIANEKYELTRVRFIDISQRCLEKMRADAAEEAKQAQNVEDQLDKKKPGV